MWFRILMILRKFVDLVALMIKLPLESYDWFGVLIYTVLRE